MFGAYAINARKLEESPQCTTRTVTHALSRSDFRQTAPVSERRLMSCSYPLRFQQKSAFKLVFGSG